MSLKIIGRFAPSPSGRMHLGNVLCAMLGYLSAKSQGGHYIIRIEDLDTLRCPRSNAEQIFDDLDWLGIKFDNPKFIFPENEQIKTELLKIHKDIINSIYQSERTQIYECFERFLKNKALVYPCYCSCSELHAASAPHLSDGRIIYAGTCKNLTDNERKQKERKPAMRLAVPDKKMTFIDGCIGKYTENLTIECGDFIIKRSDGVFAYQLAVTVDDGLMGINEVVRGNDLIGSTARQIWLHNELGFKPPKFYHMPLLVAHDGRRLSKRDKDLDLSKIRKYMKPEKLIGILACSAGLIEKPEDISLNELIKTFSWDKIPNKDLILPDCFKANI